MDGITFSDIIMCIILLSVCISLIPILKYEFKLVRKIKMNCTNTTDKVGYYNNETRGTVRISAKFVEYTFQDSCHTRSLENRGFMLSYFVLIVLIILILLVVVLKCAL